MRVVSGRNDPRLRIGVITLANYIVRKCIKNYDQVEDTRVRTAYGVLGSIVGIICNLALFVLKLLVGLAIHSMAVTADALNNLSDTASSIISLFGARAASRPADREHPFGHGRIEYVASLVVSFIILEVGLSFLRESIGKIRHPEKMQFSWLALLLLLISIGIKLWMSFFNRSLAKSINSSVLKATSTDSLIDAITTGVTVLSLLIYVMAGINIDGITSLLVSLLIIWAGIGIIKDTLTPLIGQSMDPEVEQSIIKLIREDQAIIDTHDLIIHSYGPESRMATIHIEVSSAMSLKEAHTVADRAEKKVLQELGIILVVHVDPVDMEDKRVIQIRGQIARILKILDTNLSFHDLQVSFDKNETMISFDLVVPYSYKEEDENRVLYQVMSFMRELDSKNHCVITIDRGAIEEVRNVAVTASHDNSEK